MKFLLIGGYSYGNPGDEAILKSTVYSLMELFGEPSFSVWTSAPGYRVSFDRDVDIDWVEWDPFRRMRGAGLAARLAGKLYKEFFPASRALLSMAEPPNRAFRRALDAADRVVFVGGGYLNSLYCVAEMNFLCRLARQSDKPVYLLGQTLGPFHNDVHRQMAREIFETAEKIVLRESQSLPEVEGFRSKVLEGADEAVTFRPYISPAQAAKVDALYGGITGERLAIGLSLRPGSGARDSYPALAASLQAVAANCERPVTFLFMPMETQPGCDDREEGREFAKYLTTGTDFRSFDGPLSVEERFEIIRRFDAFVGMRLHALVFALSSGVPSIGLYQDDYYRRKISGLFETFGVVKSALALDHPAPLAPILSGFLRNRDTLHRALGRSSERLNRLQRTLMEAVLR